MYSRKVFTIIPKSGLFQHRLVSGIEDNDNMKISFVNPECLTIYSWFVKRV